MGSWFDKVLGTPERQAPLVPGMPLLYPGGPSAVPLQGGQRFPQPGPQGVPQGPQMGPGDESDKLVRAFLNSSQRTGQAVPLHRDSTIAGDCPHCGSPNYVVPKGSGVTTTNGVVYPALKCFDCGYSPSEGQSSRSFEQGALGISAETTGAAAPARQGVNGHPFTSKTGLNADGTAVTNMMSRGADWQVDMRAKA